MYGALVVGLAAALLVMSHLLGQRHRERTTGEPYESGIAQTGNARVRFPAGFYVVAMVFVIFDLEAVFLFAWAIAGRTLGWQGYGEVLLFIVILLAALGYLWRLGGLEWNPAARPRDGR